MDAANPRLADNFCCFDSNECEQRLGVVGLNEGAAIRAVYPDALVGSPGIGSKKAHELALTDALL